MAKSLVLLISIISTLLMITLAAASSSSSSSVPDNNVLLTGDVLSTGNQLSYQSASFVMQQDCNLVLYNNIVGGGFVSDTYGLSDECTLKLNNRGQLEIHIPPYERPFWIYPPSVNNNSTTVINGDYAAVLGPDEHVTVYGPAIWSSTVLLPARPPNKRGSTSTVVSTTCNNNIPQLPQVRNVLFSSQVLYGNGQLATREYRLAMRDDCNLVLTKGGGDVVWESGTSGKGGRHCFVRLGHRGRLDINDDLSNTVWRSTSTIGEEGDYVLILQINGKAVVYGPAVWSTSSSSSSVASSF